MWVICPELRKNALFIDQSHASNFALYTINGFIMKSKYGHALFVAYTHSNKVK